MNGVSSFLHIGHILPVKFRFTLLFLQLFAWSFSRYFRDHQLNFLYNCIFLIISRRNEFLFHSHHRSRAPSFLLLWFSQFIFPTLPINRAFSEVIDSHFGVNFETRFSPDREDIYFSFRSFLSEIFTTPIHFQIDLSSSSHSFP